MFYALLTNVQKKKLTTHFTTLSSTNKKTRNKSKEYNVNFKRWRDHFMYGSAELTRCKCCTTKSNLEFSDILITTSVTFLTEIEDLTHVIKTDTASMEVPQKTKNKTAI